MARSRCAAGAELGVVDAPQHVAEQQQGRLVCRVQVVDHQ
jgi:hypothetical protein